MGDVADGAPVLCRVHSECLTGDVFGSCRCDCGEQLERALQMIAKEGRGVLVYLRQEGRGIGLLHKIKAYHGVAADDITLAWVPGAFEIPLVAKKLAKSGQYDAIICVGAVIRGATSHYDYVCAEVSKGIAQVGLESGVPVLFGVLTTDTIQQALERAGSKAGNKGYDCAMSALELSNLLKEV